MSDCFCTKTYQCLLCENAETRAQAIVENRALTRKVAKCGTRAGYNRHRKMNEPTCQPCKDAQTEAVIRWKREKAMQ
jgi:hypothetical protein